MKPSVPAIAAVLIVSGLLVGARPGFGEETVCGSRLGAVTVDNVRVPEGERCILNGTRVEGTIKVDSRARLEARRVRVIGNIQAEGAAAVHVLARSSIGGSVQIGQGRAAVVDSSRITGDIQLDSNEGRLAVTRNTVGGSVQAFKNTRGLEISDNFIDANLQCKENDPAPRGRGNTVKGNKENQCRRL